MSSPRNFKVRTFDTSYAFDSTGYMKDKPQYEEDLHFATTSAIPKWCLMNNLPALQKDDWVHIKILPSRKITKDEREEMVTILENWAEKSRVQGVRGFRSSAIKRPELRNNHKNGPVLDIEVIFGHVVWYTNTLMKIDVFEDADYRVDNIKLLKQQLNRQFRNRLTVNVKFNEYALIPDWQSV